MAKIEGLRSLKDDKTQVSILLKTDNFQIESKNLILVDFSCKKQYSHSKNSPKRSIKF